MADKERYAQMFEGLAKLGKKPIKEDAEDANVKLDVPAETGDEEVEPIIDPELGVDGVSDDVDTDKRSYMGMFVAECGICGAPFFVPNETIDSETTCPMCGAGSEELSVVGKVGPVEDETDGEPETPDVPEDEDNTSDDTGADDTENTDSEEDKKDDDLEFEESSFNVCVRRYLRENYNNVIGYRATGVKVSGNRMTVEGVIRFRSGRDRKVSFVTEAMSLRESANRKNVVKASFSFIPTSKAFQLEYKVIKGKICCEGLTYKYNVKSGGKTYEVSGTTSFRK